MVEKFEEIDPELAAEDEELAAINEELNSEFKATIVEEEVKGFVWEEIEKNEVKKEKSEEVKRFLLNDPSAKETKVSGLTPSTKTTISGGSSYVQSSKPTTSYQTTASGYGSSAYSTAAKKTVSDLVDEDFDKMRKSAYAFAKEMAQMKEDRRITYNPQLETLGKKQKSIAKIKLPKIMQKGSAGRKIGIMMSIIALKGVAVALKEAKLAVEKK